MVVINNNNMNISRLIVKSWLMDKDIGVEGEVRNLSEVINILKRYRLKYELKSYKRGFKVVFKT